MPAFLAGTPVAVLAGFDFSSTLVVLSQRPTEDSWERWAGASAGLFLIAATCFLVSLALAGRAQFVMVTPDQAAAWWPEIRLDGARLDRVRSIVWESRDVVKARVHQARRAWTFGLWFTALAVGVGILSYGFGAERLVAAAVALLGVAVVSLVDGRQDSLAGAKDQELTTLTPRAASLVVDDRYRTWPISFTRTALRAAGTPLYAQCEAVLDARLDGAHVDEARLVGTVVTPTGHVPAVALGPVSSRRPGDDVMVGMYLAGLEASSGIPGAQLRDAFVDRFGGTLALGDSVVLVWVGSAEVFDQLLKVANLCAVSQRPLDQVREAVELEVSRLRVLRNTIV